MINTLATNEYSRTLTEVITNGAVKTTYVGNCQDDTPLTVATTKSVWRITKYVETTVSTTVTTLQYRPTNKVNADRGYNFIRDNRTSLNYV